MQNIRVMFHSTTMIAIHWETDDGRYHVWLEPDTYKSRGIILKNPVVERGHNDYFDTRRLDATNKTNAPLMVEVMRVVEAGDLIGKAKAEYDAELATEQAERDERAKLIQQAKDLFGFFRNCIANDEKWVLSPDQMKALLTFAPAS